MWLKFSNGKFGFSVQKEIYQQLGGTREFDPEIWDQFGDTVGWRDDYRGWKKVGELNWRRPLRDNTPGGHLPVPFRRCSWGLFSRAETCKL
nr:GUN4 domain-containing protein [Geitlerinema sp. PCC 9228]